MTMHFLAGLPRSGSTLLAAVLNQHPGVRATSTSGLFDVIGAAVGGWEGSAAVKAAGGSEGEILALIRAIADEAVRLGGRPMLLDKCRTWPMPRVMDTMAEALGRPIKIVATVRSVPDCAASLLRIARPPVRSDFLLGSELIEHLKASYACLREGYRHSPASFLFVDYDRLLDEPAAVLSEVETFLDLEPHAYDFDRIDGSTVKELDAEVWKVPGLHDVAPRLGRRSLETAADVLGPFFDEFDQAAFWRADQTPAAPKLLDLALAASLEGRFEDGRVMLRKRLEQAPLCPRAAFNLGWHRIRDGDLIEGHKALSTGRQLQAWGAPSASAAPLWDGVTRETVLLHLEGGLGDQIHGAKYAREIAARGARVILACDPSLARLLGDAEGVHGVVASHCSGWVLHDSQVLAMDAPIVLEKTPETLQGAPYIPRPCGPVPGRIGLRWSGNPHFEHQQHRRFPIDLLFEAVKGAGASYVSLQRDEEATLHPAWVKEVPLDDWQATQRAVASCELVVTSCTSVAHLAAAMGVPTWIVVPLLPYYLWAQPGPLTKHYDSVRLFRQTVAGSWAEPFAEIRAALMEKAECPDMP